MSSRYQDYDKGSSRSTRDDSRTVKDRHSVGRGYEMERVEREREKKPRSRSRSPRRRRSPHSSSRSKYSSDRSRSRDKDHNDRTSPWEINSDSEEDVPAPPPPPRISKITIGFSKPKAPIKMNLGGTSKPTSTMVPKPAVASVFNPDEDDEPEEMPAEAKMRMRNIGRETPTSAGPNSFGKTKQGFCDAKKVFEKNLKQALETADKPAAPMMKFPQTIYKISGP